MIVLQMLRQQYKHRDVLSSEYAQHYVSVATIFVESATLYSVFSILLLATYATGHPINQIWLGLNPSVQVRAFDHTKVLSLSSDLLSDGVHLSYHIPLGQRPSMDDRYLESGRYAYHGFYKRVGVLWPVGYEAS